VLAAKVDALLQTGESIRAVAALTGVDRFAVARHKKHAFPQAEPEPENLDDLQLSEKRLASLADRLEAQYSAAIATADGKLGVDILKTLSRVEAERHHRIVTRKQAEIDDAESDPIKAGSPSPAFNDYLLKRFEELRAQEQKVGKVACPLCNSRSPVDFMFPQTFRKRARQLLVNDGYLVTAPATVTEEKHDNSNAN
jgi:hypothetical protein